MRNKYKQIPSLVLLGIYLCSCNPIQSHKLKSDITDSTAQLDNGLINMTQNGCASWQAIEFNTDEKLLLNEMLKREYYSYNSLKDSHRNPLKLYIKTIDKNFIDDERVVHDPNDTTMVKDYIFNKNKYQTRQIGYSDDNSFRKNFDASLYRKIKQKIEQVDIKDFDQLIDDPNAQYILKLDSLGMHELYYLLNDKTLTQSYDSTSNRKLTIGDLANGLLMIIYGQDFWEDITYPAPVKYLYNLKFEQLIPPPNWSNLSITQKNNALLEDDYLRFISRAWNMSIWSMSHIDQDKIVLENYGHQNPEWVESILINYPDVTQPYTYKNYVSQPIIHKPETLNSLKYKLEQALDRAIEVLEDCEG